MTDQPPINPALLQAAHQLSGLATSTETIHLALREFIQRRRAAQREIFELFGTIEYDDDDDYKRHR